MDDRSLSFKIGDYITGLRAGQACEAVILDKKDDDTFLILFLSDHQCNEIGRAELANWQQAAVPDARWVEVFSPNATEPFFRGYLPSLTAAFGVYEAFRRREGAYRVVIHTASEYEDQLLEEMIDPSTARGYA
jgi:hypothetical protein